MPDQDTTIADGDPGHAQLHVDNAVEINSLRARLATAESTISTQGTTLATKSTKPAQGWALPDLDPSVQTAIGQVQIRRYVNGAWQARGTTSLDVTVIWLKFTAADPNPPAGGSHVLVGHDVVALAAA